MLTSEASTELVSASVKMAPPAGIAGAVFLGMTLADWVMAATLFYTVLQIGVLIYKFNKENRLWPRLRAALGRFMKRSPKS